VHELQVLRNELDVDERAGRIFEIPAVGVALFLGDCRAHLDDVSRDNGRLALAAEHLAKNSLYARGKFLSA
jgi:hypothetical protein